MMIRFKKWWRKKSKGISISKRQVFVCMTLILTAGLVVTQFTQETPGLGLVVGLSVGTYIVAAIALREDLRGVEFITLLTLPTLFTAAVSLFYFLLPQRLLTRLPIAALFAIGMYAILLTENIYNVAVERTIQLLRAAQSVGFVITLITAFFLFDALFSFRGNALINMGFAFLISFSLTLQSLWSMELNSRLSKEVLIGSGVVGWLLAQAALVLSFWPIGTTMEALFLTTIFYTFTGMAQQYLVGRLFAQTQKEFLAVLCIVFVLVVFTTHWGYGNF